MSPQGRCCQGAAGSGPADLAVSHSDLSAATPCVTQSNQTALDTQDRVWSLGVQCVNCSTSGGVLMIFSVSSAVSKWL